MLVNLYLFINCKCLFSLLNVRDQLKVWLCLCWESLVSEKPHFHLYTMTAKFHLHMLTCAFLSLFSGPALHHFNGTTPTERRWQRAKCRPSTAVAQRATSGSILWHPLWCRACICWLVRQRTCVFKVSQTNCSWATAISRAFWQSTSFFYAISHCKLF